MICTICGLGEAVPGFITVTLEQDKSTLVFKHVPARVCTVCGESYLDDTTSRALLQAAEAAVRAGVTVEIREFSAA
jgi:YgiT-type zinc finger domain-containing protein